jgi:hypothetical protein
MSVAELSPEAAKEVEEHAARLEWATVAYMARLGKIADISTLTAGAHGYNYAVTVPQDEKPQVLPRLADLTFEIEDEFGVKITTLAVAGPARRAKLRR